MKTIMIPSFRLVYLVKNCVLQRYICQSYLKATGENFSKYVENCRMKKAKELIDQGKKVKEVAELVGYNSPQVFRRAWKRYYDHVPSENQVEEEKIHE